MPIVFNGFRVTGIFRRAQQILSFMPLASSVLRQGPFEFTLLFVPSSQSHVGCIVRFLAYPFHSVVGLKSNSLRSTFENRVPSAVFLSKVQVTATVRVVADNSQTSVPGCVTCLLCFRAGASK